MIQAIFHWHAFVEIENNGQSILIDPFITWNPQVDIKLDDILNKNIKAIVLTHWHQDHLWDAVEISKKTWCLVVATYELVQYLQNEEWLTNLHAMHIGGEHNFWDFVVKFVPAVHWGWIGDLKKWYTTFAAWVVVRIDWKNIYHAGDTGLTYDMKILWEYDSIDVAFLPIWDNFTMWIKDAVIATKWIKPKIVVPIHYNTWPIIQADPLEFARQVMLQNLAVPKVLEPWQSVVLK